MSKNAQLNNRAFMHKIIPYRYCYKEAGMIETGNGVLNRTYKVFPPDNQMLYNMVKGNDLAVLGTTEEGAISFAQNAIENLSDATGHNSELARLREREREFYNTFINKIKEVR